MLTLQLAIASTVITRLTAGIGYRLGFADHPDGRKAHRGIVPLTGGFAVLLTILCGALVFGISPYSIAMLVIACLVFAVGAFDDIRHINPWLRLLIQYGAGLLMATWGGLAIHNVGNLLGMGDIPLLMLAVPLTALSVAGLSNAYNMIDGTDGLAAAMTALPLLLLYALASRSGHAGADFLLLMLIPLATFLLFNLGPDNRLLPKVFLGDSGSMTTGFLVTASLVYFSQGENALIMPVTALWLVAVPLMDMLATMLRRANQGRKLMEADHSHLHHTLIDMGFSSRQTLGLLVVYATACALTGLALERIPACLSLACYLLLFLGHCAFVLRSDTVNRPMSHRLGESGADGDTCCEPN